MFLLPFLFVHYYHYTMLLRSLTVFCAHCSRVLDYLACLNLAREIVMAIGTVLETTRYKVPAHADTADFEAFAARTVVEV